MKEAVRFSRERKHLLVKVISGKTKMQDNKGTSGINAQGANSCSFLSSNVPDLTLDEMTQGEISKIQYQDLSQKNMVRLMDEDYDTQEHIMSTGLGFPKQRERAISNLFYL